MTADRLREALQKRPFERFVIHMADGREVRVDHPELAALAASGRTVGVFQRDDSFTLIDVLLITDLHWLPAPRQGRERSGRG
jgi:hypothetical protein